MKTPFTLLPLLALVACGGSETSTINPHGACADAIATYEEANNVAPSDPGTQADYAIGGGNYRVFYIGVEAGEVRSASFYWGTDYQGCQATFD